MCGIAGIFTLEGSINARLVAGVLRMMDAQVHRGPDDWGLLLADGTLRDPEVGALLAPFNPGHIRTYKGPASPEVVLGHRRLSIIDLSPRGRQPMSNRDGTVWITYNGEVYNYRELRDELKGKGYRFHSDTDTEAILHGYEEWGEGVVDRLRGMFAFALSDGRATKLLLARDYFGIKPLYYHQDSQVLVFASEVRALLASGLVPEKENRDALRLFLQTGSIPAPYTTAETVFSIPAAHYLLVDQTASRLERYWGFPTFEDDRSNPNAVISETRALLEESVRIHLVSDVPIGIFLSGGIDSSSLVALASRSGAGSIKTLSVVFDEAEHDESRYARLIADKYHTEHTECRVTSPEYWQELPKIFEAMDQPTVNGVNTYFVSKAALQAGLKVVLSGLGGDEVFWGYKHFAQVRQIATFAQALGLLPGGIRRMLLKGIAAAGIRMGHFGLDKLAYLEQPTPENCYWLLRGLFSPREVRAFMGETSGTALPQLCESSHPWSENTLSRLEFQFYLQNQLLKDADIMSMAHSIEERVPILDRKLVEHVAKTPAQFMLRGGTPKSLLVNALGELLPKSIVYRHKQGFTFPFGKWMKQYERELLEMVLERNIADRQLVQRIWEEFIGGKIHWSRPWALVVLSRWQKNAYFS